jgi:hypothetical protein
MEAGSYRLSTPVVFIVFNRPESTRRVFAEIRRARPSRLLLVADGPRANRPNEAGLCAEVRRIVQEIDWDCKLSTNLSEVNLGCKKRVSSGIDWAFDQVEEAIILEDDCLPDPTFFRFCQELLERYRDNRKVMSIGGANFQGTHDQSLRSYYFSQFVHIWGWASWRRAWKPHYDVTMAGWPSYDRSGQLRERVGSLWATWVWRRAFQRVYAGLVDTWDYQWTFAVWKNHGVSVVPEVNLISNIGFDAQATHTRLKEKSAEMPTEAMRFPLRSPVAGEQLLVDDRADAYTERRIFSETPFVKVVRKTADVLGYGR